MKRSKNKKRSILVAAHHRSGIHFAINAICMNFFGCEFSLIRNFYTSLDGLFLHHDREYIREWERCLRERDNKIKLFKTHFTPSEISLALSNDFFLGRREKEILKEIYEDSKIISIHRDGRDALVSMHYFYKEGMPQSANFRFRESDFSEFLRMPNKHYAQIRGFEEQDENRAKYWSSHVNEWLAKEDAIHISYESLNGDFEATVKSLAASLGIEEYIVDRIKRPQLHPSFKTDILSRGLRKAKRVSMSSVLGDKYIDESKIVLPSCARKGIVGDWKNHFSDADLEFFLKFAKDTMFKLNYKI